MPSAQRVIILRIGCSDVQARKRMAKKAWYGGSHYHNVDDRNAFILQTLAV